MKERGGAPGQGNDHQAPTLHTRAPIQASLLSENKTQNLPDVLQTVVASSNGRAAPEPKSSDPARQLPVNMPSQQSMMGLMRQKTKSAAQSKLSKP